jgi:hypothetical protein
MRRQPATDEKPLQLKEILVDKARRGVFNHNPLLSTTHFLTCQKCRHKQSIIYLDYLKSGQFKIGKTEQIEVFTSHGPIAFLDKETVTPIIINLLCEVCDCQIESRPVSFEYLQTITKKPTTRDTMYV